ncbi:MAG: hypothetical protein KC546_21695 [Anaerolineae bacterium]|nr:hypothetical protein [Anaerolineae bacterium]
MDNSVEWVIEDRLIRTITSGSQTVEVMIDTSATIVSMLESSSAETIHIICDLSDITTMPLDLLHMKQALEWTHHPKVGWIVSYGTRNSAITYVTSVLGRLLNVKYQHQPSYPQAISFLMKKDGSIGNFAKLVERNSA